MEEISSETMKVVETLLATTDFTDCTIGVCVSCNAVLEGVEPDATEYECDQCGKFTVYGLEELSLTMYS
jgi:predicted RNA-binding Zn-ribbon protein involved in translation (DUF1610 family)